MCKELKSTIATDKEIEKIRLHKEIIEFNATSFSYSKNSLIHEIFEYQSLKNPDNLAIECGDMKYTYSQLNSVANSIASSLIAMGLGNENIVAIAVNRSFEMIASILGVLKSGCAYLPIDPDYPQERIDYMLQDSNSKLLITSTNVSEKSALKCKNIVTVEDLITAENNMHVHKNINNDLSTLAYLIYTSGSSGTPKGVMIEHMSVVNLVEGIWNAIDFSNCKKFLATTTVSFDIFVLETLFPLLKGMSIVLADEIEQIDPLKLHKLVEKYGTDVIQMTPSRISMLLNSTKGEHILQSSKIVLVGGEALPLSLLKKIQSITRAEIFNMYGPTETTVWSTVKRLTNSNIISIGKPIANTRIYMLDDDNRILSIGNEGELSIAGDGLSRGYLNNDEMTKNKFINLNDIIAERVYKTGDLAEWLPNGEIKLLGRLDDQIKLRGHRIELGEIEYQTTLHKSITAAVAVVSSDNIGSDFICMYFMADDKINIPELKEHLLMKLPEYMVPSYFIQIDNIPYTPNGKVDKKELKISNKYMPLEKTCLSVKEDMTSYLEKEDTETKILKVWRNVLLVDDIRLTDKFFEIGGNSINIVQVSTELNKVFNVEISIKDMLRLPTISDLAQHISKSRMEYEHILDDTENLFDIRTSSIKTKQFLKNFNNRRRRKMSELSYDQVRDKVKELINEMTKSKMDNEQNVDDLRLGTQIGFDSTLLMELIVRLESFYGIRVPNEDLIPENFSTIRNVSEYVVNLTDAKRK